jgi:hypothetical protein
VANTVPDLSPKVRTTKRKRGIEHFGGVLSVDMTDAADNVERVHDLTGTQLQ